MDPKTRNAMQQLTRRWTQAQPAVSAFISSLIPDFHDAEDCLQRVAAIVVTKYDQYDPARPFVAWAIGIARYEVLKARRTIAREKIIFDEQATRQIATAFEEIGDGWGEYRQALQHCIRKLKGRSREAIQMQYQQELTTAQMARRLKMTSNALFVMLHRTRASLRKCIKQHQLRIDGGKS